MKRTQANGAAKSARQSAHLLNRLLGWRWRGMSSQDPQPLGQSSVGQGHSTPTRDSPETNVLFSTAQLFAHGNTSESESSHRIIPSATQDTPFPIHKLSSNVSFKTGDPTADSAVRAALLIDNPVDRSPNQCITPVPPSVTLPITCTPAADMGNVKHSPIITLPAMEDSSSKKPSTATIILSSTVHNVYNQTQDSSNHERNANKETNKNDRSLKHALTQKPSDKCTQLNCDSPIPMQESSNLQTKSALFEQEMSSSFPVAAVSSAQKHFASNFDQRYSGQYLTPEQLYQRVEIMCCGYSGQYLTPEQLPEFCDQLHQLVNMIRNIQSYSTITGEYPSAMERRLDREAREVAALAAEVRNARECIERVRLQRRAVRAQRRETARHLASLREEELRELESVVRAADRKLFKSWEIIRDAVEVCAFDSLLTEVKGKLYALQCLTQLIENRCAALLLLQSSSANLAPHSTLPPLPNAPASAEQSPRTRYYPSKRPFKRKRRERDMPSHSVPVSSEPSQHSTDQTSSRNRLSSICTANNQRSVNINPMSVPYELISQSGIPANMLPSMGSNSNHNLTINGTLPSFIPFRFSARQFGPASEMRVTNSNRDTVGDMVFMRIDDRSTDV